MEENYDFSRIGKQMPYTVPDGFFEKLEEDVVGAWNEECGMRNEDTSAAKRAKVVRMAVRAAIAVAACIALLLIVKKALPQGQDAAADDFDSVELAFNNLSTEDQYYLLEVYQEEQFLDNYLNELDNEESI
jgi:hypothetical protein